MARIILFLLVIMATISCNKQGASSSTPPPPAQVSANASAILIPSVDSQGRGAIICYNPDLTLKWQKKLSYGGIVPGMVYQKNVIYVAQNLYTSQQDPIYTGLYALNIQTGDSIWHSKLLGELIDFNVQGDTMYVTVNISYNIYLILYNAKTGDSISTTNLSMTRSAALGLISQENILYFFGNQSIYNYTLFAYDLSLKALRWQYQLGTNISSMFVSDSLIFTENNGSILAIDKNTGMLVWSKTDEPYIRPVINDKTVYCFSSTDQLSGPFVLTAFNASDGAAKWKDTIPFTFSTSDLSPQDDNVYITGSDPKFNPGGRNCFLSSIDINNGKAKWKTATSFFASDLIATSDKIYCLDQLSAYPLALLIVFNTTTGNVENSITLPVAKLSGNFFGVVTTADTFTRTY